MQLCQNRIYCYHRSDFNRKKTKLHQQSTLKQHFAIRKNSKQHLVCLMFTSEPISHCPTFFFPWIGYKTILATSLPIIQHLKKSTWLGMVAHTWNSSYSRYQGGSQFKANLDKNFARLHPNHKKLGVVVCTCQPYYTRSINRITVQADLGINSRFY
jgi:hypothetical protein